MEAELSKFRRRKELQQKREKLKEKVTSAWDRFTTKMCAALLPTTTTLIIEEDQDNNGEIIRNRNDPEDSDEESEGANDERNKDPLRWLKLSLCSLTWFMFFIAFVKIEFGAVFFAISLLLFICWNTGNRRRRKGEVSAYSVFNEGCAAIDGTLKPEHLEKQLLYRGT